MQKIYSLLRSNKQSGPYTLEELLHLNLKPFDLIWAEGKTAGWCYPSEIDALKPFLSDPIKTIETKKVDTPQQLQPVLNIEKKTPVISSTDKAQSTTNHVYVSLPSGTSTKENNITYTKPLDEEETPEAKLERKAQELRNKIQAFTENKSQPKADNELDVKYARSLDDIKEEYSSWLYQQKKKKNLVSNKTVFIAVGAMAAAIAVYFILPLLFQTKKTNDQILSAQEILLSAPVLNEVDNSYVLGENENKAVAKKVPGKMPKRDKINPPLSKNSEVKQGAGEVDSYLDSLHSVKEADPAQVEKAYEPTYTSDDGTRQKTKRESETTANNSSIKKETDSVPFEQLVKLAESNGSEKPHLTLYNNSNKFIKFVAVDVYYYKDNKKLLQKKTLYFNDISAMSSAKLFVPFEKKAASVRYEMGLISTDGGLYYAKN